MLKDAQKDEHLSDMEKFLGLQSQMAGAAAAEGGDPVPTAAGSTSTVRGGAVAKAKAAGLGKFVERFGLSAFQFGVNVSLEMKKNDVEDDELMPEKLAEEYECASYPDADSVLRGARNMLSRQLADEPQVRRHVRQQYRNEIKVETAPTARGKEEIDRNHRLNGIRHIAKPVENLRGQEFLVSQRHLPPYFPATFRPFCAVFSPFFRGFRLPGAKTERTGEKWRKMGEICGGNGREIAVT